MRHECKYLLDEHLAARALEFMRPFVRVDRHLEERGTRDYPVCTLYLDTPDLDLYKQTQQGIKNRFKLRIRSYEDLPASPLFLEIKRRMNGIVSKRRFRVKRELVMQAVTGYSHARDAIVPDAAEAAEFAVLTATTGCRPALKVKYMRQAYESSSGDPVRLTFDTDLAHVVTHRLDVALEDSWRPTPMRGIVLEIKFTDRYPSWVGHLVQALDLQRVSVPKYCLSMERALLEGGYSRRLVADLPHSLGGA